MDKISDNISVGRVIVGTVEANCYILSDNLTREAIIIDPGDEPEKIKRYLEKNKLTPKIIICTHGHIDHVGAVDDFSLPVFIHKLDKDSLADPSKNLSFLVGIPKTFSSQIKELKDNDKISLGAITLEVMHTPGHTPGGISLKLQNVIFTGDTLFYAGVGRTDFPGASEEELFNSIRSRLMVFSDDVIIYPGHGPYSTIGRERERNLNLL